MRSGIPSVFEDTYGIRPPDGVNCPIIIPRTLYVPEVAHNVVNDVASTLTLFAD